MIGKIRRMDHTGDSVIAEYDPEVKESVEVAQDALTRFLEDSVARFGVSPPVWGRRLGEQEFDMLDKGNLDLAHVEEVVLQYPLAGG